MASMISIKVFKYLKSNLCIFGVLIFKKFTFDFKGLHFYARYHCSRDALGLKAARPSARDDRVFVYKAFICTLSSVYDISTNRHHVFFICLFICY